MNNKNSRTKKINSNNLLEELLSSSSFSSISDWNDVHMFNSEQDYQLLVSEKKRLQDKFDGDFVKKKIWQKRENLFLL